MKRLALIAVAVIVIAAAAWSAVWYSGRSRIETALDREIALLRERGFAIEHGEREIGGFPLGYEVTYRELAVTDAAGGISYDLPSLTGASTLGDPGRLAFRFPQKFAATLRFDETVREAYPTLPETLPVDIEATDLVVETDGAEGAAMTVVARADDLLAVTSDEAAEMAVALELTGLDAALTVPRDSEVGTVSVRAAIDGFDYAASVVDPDEVRITMEGQGEALSVSGSSSLRSRAQWEALFAGGNSGEAEFAYQTGPMLSQIRVENGQDGMDGTVAQSAGTGGGVVRIGDGRIELRGSSENNRFELAPAAAEAPVRGALSLSSLEVVYEAPIAPAEEMADFTIRLALSGLEVEESLWKLIDPEETLSRESAHLILEIAGTGRLRPVGPEAPAGSPIELGNLEIVAASAEALGASAVAEGAVEFIQPINLPEGTIEVRTRNLLDVIAKLSALGVVEPGTHQAATLMSTLYTTPGASREELVSEIEFTLDGVMINGLRVR